MNGAQAAYAIDVRGLSKSYHHPSGGEDQASRVLERISLALAPGAFVSLVGPSGTGKSTLLNILAGLEPTWEGSVSVLGHPPQPGVDAAYMQQKDLLLPWRTLWENILLAPELKSRQHRQEREALASQLLKDFGLAGFEGHFPAQLSGGMRQRAALIRTLLCEQPIFLLDEPFGALDAITRRRLQGLLLNIWRDYHKTVLLVTHDVDEALFLSQKILVVCGVPGRVRREFSLSLPHGERPGSPEMLGMKLEILALLEEDHV